MHATTETNHTVSAGTTIKLGCETDTESKIRWYFNSPERVLLYSGYQVNSSVAWRVSVIETVHRNDLTVLNVTRHDSGMFSCHEVDKFSQNVSFYVTVKEKGTLMSILLIDYTRNFPE